MSSIGAARLNFACGDCSRAEVAVRLLRRSIARPIDDRLAIRVLESFGLPFEGPVDKFVRRIRSGPPQLNLRLAAALARKTGFFARTFSKT